MIAIYIDTVCLPIPKVDDILPVVHPPIEILNSSFLRENGNKSLTGDIWIFPQKL